MKGPSASLPGGAVSRLYRARSYDGWKYLLPVGTLGRVACVDGEAARTALALSDLCDEVIAVPLRRRAAIGIRQQVHDAGRTNVKIVDCLSEWCPEANGPLDGLVMTVGGASGLVAGEATPVARDSLVETLTRARGALTETGFIFVSATNSLAYNRFSRPGSARDTVRTVGGGALTRLVRRIGYRHGRLFPLLTRNDRQIVQVLMPTGYRSFQSGGGYAEPLRELLLGRIGGRWCAPEYGVLAYNGARRPSLFEELAGSCDEQSDNAASPSLVKRYIVLSDKIVLSLGRGRGPHGERMVVVPFTEVGRRRRHHEAQILQQARRLPEGLRAKIPRPLGAGKFRNTSFVVIEELRGLCVDSPVRDLESICAAATDFLVRLHQHSSADLLMNADRWNELCGGLFAAAAIRHRGARPLLGRIEAHVRRMVLGASLPAVWMHGDFKIENIVVDRATRQPSGVIDWELSQLRGLPLLDLLYLLTYNHMLRRDEGFHRAYRNVVLAGDWRPWESRLLDTYVDRLSIDPVLTDAMVAMLPIHALACRLTYDMSTTKDRRAVLGMLEALVAHLETLGSTRGTVPTGTYG